MPEKVTPPNPEQALQALKETVRELKPGVPDLEGFASAYISETINLIPSIKPIREVLRKRVERARVLAYQFKNTLEVLAMDHPERATVLQEWLILDTFLKGAWVGEHTIAGNEADAQEAARQREEMKELERRSKQQPYEVDDEGSVYPRRKGPYLPEEDSGAPGM